MLATSIGREPWTADAIGALVQPDRVHRSVYTDPELFELEIERIWHRAWIYVGHESQVRNTGDYFSTEIVRNPVLMVRHSDGSVRVLFNRCAHKGVMVARCRTGTVRNFICPYHGWNYGTDGTLKGVPLPDGYKGTMVQIGNPDFGLKPLPRVANYRGFVFASLAEDGPSLTEFLGPATVGFDDMVERAPDGEVEVYGTCARTIQHANWKLFFENQLDAVHAGVTHRSLADSARDVARSRYSDPAQVPKVVQNIAMHEPPDAKSFWTKLNSSNYRYGHGFLGGYQEHRGQDPATLEYESLIKRNHGEAEGERRLARNLHHTVIYPCLSIQSQFQQLRVVKPIAVDRTLMEIWHFRLKGAPSEFLRRNIAMAANLANTPATPVSVDDYENWYRAQTGLKAQAQEWVSIHRDYGGDRIEGDVVHSRIGTSEAFQRNQYAAWADYMKREA
jgi:phenylpropionate dioxygenase-like ring-hydroxylating dioxygenase large terminal subunit